MGNQIQLLTIGIGSLAFVVMVLMNHNFKNTVKWKQTATYICIVLIALSLLILTINNVALGQGLYIVATLALVFAAYETMKKSEEQNNRIIEHGRLEQADAKQDRILNELADWVTKILEVTFDTSLTDELFNLNEEYKKLGKPIYSLEEIEKITEFKFHEHEIMILISQLTKRNYMFNLAKQFKIDDLVKQFVDCVGNYIDFSMQERGKQTINNRVLGKQYGEKINAIRWSGNQILERVANLKVDSLAALNTKSSDA
jgi:hypothetical protein